MRNMLRRVARLERALGVSDVLDPTMVITNVFIDSDGTAVDTIVLKRDPPHVQRQRALAGLQRVTSAAALRAK
jgi:hypothetical protein